MILTTSWGLEPLPPVRAVLAAAVSDCLSCTNDLLLCLWRSAKARCAWSQDALSTMIQAIHTEAIELEAEIAESPPAATLVMISDLNSICASPSPSSVHGWLSLRIEALLARLMIAAEAVCPGDGIIGFMIQHAAHRIQAAWAAVPPPEIPA